MHHGKCLNTNDSVGALKENRASRLHEGTIILVHCYTFNVQVSAIYNAYKEGGGGIQFVYINAVLCFQALWIGWRQYWCSNNLNYANWGILSIGNWLTLRHAFVGALVMHWWGAPPPRRSPALRQIKFIHPSVFSRLPSIRIITSALTPNRPVPARPWSLPRTSMDELKL